jgi:hypothetical protein
MGEGIIYILCSTGVQGRGRDHGYTQYKDIGGRRWQQATSLLAALPFVY